MKTIIALAILTFATAAQADTLVKYAKRHGFQRNPTDIWITIDSNGDVTSYVKNVQKNKTTSQVVAQLSETAVSTLKEAISSIDPKAQPEDTKPDAPKCTDVPSTSGSVWIKNAEVTIYRTASCHTYKLADGSGDNLIAIAKAFYKLAGF